MGEPAQVAQELKPFLVPYLELLGLKVKNNMTNCPICGSGTGKHKSGALSIYNGNLMWKCHACGRHGDLVQLIQYMDDCTYGAALVKGKKLFLSDRSVTLSAPRVKTAEQWRSNIAPVAKRNAFYQAVLGQLYLSQSHAEILLNRGIPRDCLWRYRSVPERIYSNTTKQKLVEITAAALMSIGDVPSGVPGFYVNENGEWTITFPVQGYIIPVLDYHGRIKGLQVRADNPKKAKYRWVSSNPDPSREHPFTSGTSAETCVHYRAGIKAADTVYLTEGPLKADVASALLGRTFLAIPGVSSTGELPNVLSFLKKQGVVRIVNALDMDRLTNPNVAEAVQKIQGIVESSGLGWVDFTWDPTFKGIDDWAAFLAARKGAQ